jgi:HEPN domain-containing protein
MINNNEDLVKEWYKFAEMDFITARHLFDTLHPKPLEIICYHCQQTVEKFLKGFLVLNDIEPPKTHNLLRLCEMCLEIDNRFEEIKTVCQFLNPYGIQPRYPNEMEIFETDANLALKNVQKVVDLFKSQNGI